MAAMNPAPSHLSLTRLPAIEQRRLLRDGDISAMDLLAAHLDVINCLNPAINAIVTTCLPEAEQAAAESDRRLRRGEARPLEGLPSVIKDTVAVSGVRTTYGSPVFANFVPSVDDETAARMRAAGAVILGKSNVPEFAAGSHTFNELFGTTVNPYDPARSAGGSSGGAAAALASGMSALADGSDTGGSLRNPAAFCNVVGFRPTPGTVSPAPSHSPWHMLTTSGPMGRTVADTRLLLTVLAPAATLSLDAEDINPATQFGIDPTGIRIAWSRNLGGLPVEQPVLDVLAEVRMILADLGCVIHDVEPDLTGVDEVFRTSRAWNYHLTWGHLLKRHRDSLKPEVVDELERGAAITRTELASVQHMNAAIVERTTALLANFDVLASPVAQVLPFPAEQRWPPTVAGQAMTDYIDWMRACWHLSTLGWPSLAVPAGFSSSGNPVGLQLAGKPNSDFKILQIAELFEQATNHWRRTPSFVRKDES
ncbi:amidase family protein [Nocardia sp. NPDC004750]